MREKKGKKETKASFNKGIRPSELLHKGEECRQNKNIKCPMSESQRGPRISREGSGSARSETGYDRERPSQE